MYDANFLTPLNQQGKYVLIMPCFISHNHETDECLTIQTTMNLSRTVDRTARDYASYQRFATDIASAGMATDDVCDARLLFMGFTIDRLALIVLR